MTDGEGAATGPLKRVPLHDLHVEAGARLVPFAGWEMPVQYTGIVAEHEAVRNAAGIFDVSHMGRVWVRGPQAGDQIRSVTTYDVNRIEPGDTHYSLYCNERGGIDDDVFVFRFDGERWLVVHNAANAEPDAARLAAATGGQSEDVGRETVMLAVQGPQAPGIVSRVVGSAYDGLEARTCTEVEWRGGTLVVSRTGYTGEDGAEIIADAERGAELWRAFVDAGVVPAGLGARDTLRLEAALPLHGHDITPETHPWEARLGWTVTLDDDADFTGRAALEKLAEQPLERRLAHIRVTERGVPREGYPILDEEGREVGTVTSGAHSPTLRAGIAMGYVPPALAAPGTPLAIEVRGRQIAAEAVRRPFYRRPRPGT